MKFDYMSFEDKHDLFRFVNERSILPDNIQQIVYTTKDRWVLFYWGQRNERTANKTTT